jgi:hypothetical protein
LPAPLQVARDLTPQDRHLPRSGDGPPTAAARSLPRPAARACSGARVHVLLLEQAGETERTVYAGNCGRGGREAPPRHHGDFWRVGTRALTVPYAARAASGGTPAIVTADSLTHGRPPCMIISGNDWQVVLRARMEGRPVRRRWRVLDD